MAHIDAHKPGTFCWIELATTDQAAAHRFYQTLFGWSLQEIPMGQSGNYDLYQLDGRTAAAGCTLQPSQLSQGVPPHWMPYIAVSNVDASASRATSLGGNVVAG